jgi:long-chain acyl-CoA synthetase
MNNTDIIPIETARTLDGLFRERVRRSPDAVAYRHFEKKTKIWVEMSWREAARQVARWQRAMEAESLKSGDRVALWLRNCPEWAILDQAALGLGLVVVPLYSNDRPENAAFILRDAGVKFLLVENEENWRRLVSSGVSTESLKRVVCLAHPGEGCADLLLRYVEQWLPDSGGELKANSNPEDLATIIYTSGTTGSPKGVKLSHHNILSNAHGGIQNVPVHSEDLFLSFLPLSHAFERTAGYYIPMMAGATVAYSRSISQLAEDFKIVRPTVVISVPRVFERIYSRIKHQLERQGTLRRMLFEWTVRLGWKRFEYRQKGRGWSPAFLFWPLLDGLVARKVRNGLGGHLRLAVSGGAALPAELAKMFIGMGINLLQGYGLTETSPLVSVNMHGNNDPSGVGLPIQGAEVRMGKGGELLVKGHGVMQGYWNNPGATADMIDEEGWLHTGDVVRLERGHIYITGRIKEIIVMLNGEKVPPADIETAISMHPLMDQAMIVGEGRSYLAALVVLHKNPQALLAWKWGLDPDSADFYSDQRVKKYVLSEISRQMHAFPGYAKVRRVALLQEPWTVENGLLTPTLKIRRERIMEKYGEELVCLYEE